MDYLETLAPWATGDTLCVCPEDGNGNRYPLCSMKEDLSCVGDLGKPGQSVDTGNRDQRSVEKTGSDREDIRERLNEIRRKRDVALIKTHRQKVNVY